MRMGTRAGILEADRDVDGTAVLCDEMCQSTLVGGFKHADIVQIGAVNDNVQREMRDLRIDFYKTHRMYECNLDT